MNRASRGCMCAAIPFFIRLMTLHLTAHGTAGTLRCIECLAGEETASRLPENCAAKKTAWRQLMSSDKARTAMDNALSTSRSSQISAT